MKRSGWSYPSWCLAALVLAGQAAATEATRESFGSMADGSKVEAVVLRNSHGMTARVISLGATLQSLTAPDAAGKQANIVLGYATLEGYQKAPQYFGATVGRYANRIARGKFTLDGHEYSVPVNDKVNSLHGGTKGFDKLIWTVADVKHDAESRQRHPEGDQPRRRHGLPRQARRHRNLHPGRGQPPLHRLPRGHRQDDHRQPEQSHVLEPLRRRLRQRDG